MVLGEIGPKIVPIPNHITRKNRMDVVTDVTSKTYQTVFTKRLKRGLFGSIPFRYEQKKPRLV